MNTDDWKNGALHKKSLTAALQHERKCVLSGDLTPRAILLHCGDRPPRRTRRIEPMAAADAVKTTVDQFSAASNVAFKEGVEKTLAALNDANAHSKKNLEAVVASVTAATKGAEALGAQAMAFSKSNFETQVAAAKSLTSAKSVQEVVELQTAFAKSALESYMAEMGRMSETVSASVKDSMKPLNERVTAMVERLQAAR
jgi:phasin family protein